MMRTCKLCGLKYQTMAESGPKYCHKCTLLTLKAILISMKPILFEYDQEQLDMINGLCVDIGVLLDAETCRRAQYFARMMDQRKPQ